MSVVSPTQNFSKPSLLSFARLVMSRLQSSRLLSVDLDPAVRFWEAAMSDDSRELNIALSGVSTWESLHAAPQHSPLAALAARAPDFELSTVSPARRRVLDALLHSAELNAPLRDAHLLSAPAIPRPRHLNAQQLAFAQSLPSVEQRLGRNARLLHWAAASGRLGLVQALLQAGAHPDGESPASETMHHRAPATSPLCLSIENGHPEVAAALLEANARLRSDVDASDERRFVNATAALDALILRGLDSAVDSPQRDLAIRWASWALEQNLPVLVRPWAIDEPTDVLESLCAALERKALWRASFSWTHAEHSAPSNWMTRTRQFFFPQPTAIANSSFCTFLSTLVSLDPKSIREMAEKPVFHGVRRLFLSQKTLVSQELSGVEWVALAAAHRATEGKTPSEKECLALEVIEAFMPLQALSNAPSHTTTQAQLMGQLTPHDLSVCEPAVAALLPPKAFAQWSQVAQAFGAQMNTATHVLIPKIQAHKERQDLEAELAHPSMALASSAALCTPAADLVPKKSKRL